MSKTNKEKKVGRPKKYDARTIPFNVKLNDNELKKLVYLMENYDMSAAEVFRFTLRTVYEDEINS